MTDNDFLFRGDIDALDPDVASLIRHETARQQQYLIMIPSESTIPYAVRSALSSSFHNIYAEGYPLEETRTMTQEEILDYNQRLPEFRRNADNRYYKGTEYANVIEALARRRTAEVFANNGYTADDLYVNVQPLSGAPANNAVYTGLLNVGDTVMGMDLIMGGHLTHGSPVNRSGKYYNIVSYTIDPETEQLDYDKMMEIALEHKPKMIIGGYSSYPLQPDWNEYRKIADAVGAYLLADVAHVAGMVAGGVYPSPVGIADAVTFTTHKTLNGPRGAVVITHRKDLSAKIDRGVFPGEQGGPHVHAMVGLAVALRLATTDQFKSLQEQTVKNAKRLADKLTSRGLHLPHGGTNTHLMVVDCKSVVGPDGTTLSGDMAARVLDLVGVVCNRQTIPGDTSPLRPSGIRLGTPWITQRGFKEAEIDALGDIIADVLQACVPFSLMGRVRPLDRTKVDFDVLQDAKIRVRDLSASVGIDTDAQVDGYPHFYYGDDALADDKFYQVAIKGDQATAYCHTVLTSDVMALADGDEQPTHILEKDGSVMASGMIKRVSVTDYVLNIAGNVGRAVAWLRSLSDGFVLFDDTDIHAKVPGPVDVVVLGEGDAISLAGTAGYAQKAYCVGINGANYFRESGDALPKFEANVAMVDMLQETPLHALHVELGAKMAPFAGYDMPLWYKAVSDEHQAVRTHAGIFDVSHMGVYDVKGAGAEQFLDAVTTNDVQRLAVGDSHYTYFLDVDGIPLDDLMIYRLASEHFLVVVNASNDAKNWQWLNAVKNGEVMIDPSDPARQIEGTDRFELRDLRAAQWGDEQRVDIALQGPASRDLLLQLAGSDADKAKVNALKWAGVAHVTLGGFDLIVSRTGYTGERVAYELFVHPDKAADLFKTFVDMGVVPCGLASRDSLRIEAGLPLYGHELEGELNMNPADAGFGTYVKLYKSFFVGKRAFVEHEAGRDVQVSRFRMDSKGARPAHAGDPIVNSRGKVVGVVTSCSVDSEGYQLGQALMQTDYRKRGTQLAVFAGSARAKAKELSNLSIGKKVNMPEAITILSRFPKQK
jgi:glycine hydroxymethyltransferase